MPTRKVHVKKRHSKNFKEHFFFTEDSKTIFWYSYCPDTLTLEVVFRGKDTDNTLRRYRYYNVWHTNFVRFATAPSVESAFNEWIIGIHRKRRMKDVRNPEFISF